MSQIRQAALQQRARELGFGGGHRTYAVTDVMGALGQMGLRSLVALGILALGMMTVMQPPSVLLKFTVVAGVLALLFGIRLAWRRAGAAFELNRVHLYADGLLVTDRFGHLRDAVAWTDVTDMKNSYGSWLFTVSHRIELGRRGSRPLVFSILGSQPELLKALQDQATRNRIPQRNVRFYVS